MNQREQSIHYYFKTGMLFSFIEAYAPHLNLIYCDITQVMYELIINTLLVCEHVDFLTISRDTVTTLICPWPTCVLLIIWFFSCWYFSISKAWSIIFAAVDSQWWFDTWEGCMFGEIKDHCTIITFPLPFFRWWPLSVCETAYAVTTFNL